jgi:hypothetical protein
MKCLKSGSNEVYEKVLIFHGDEDEISIGPPESDNIYWGFRS